MSEELRAALGKIANSGRASHPILDAFQMSEIAAAALRASTDAAAVGIKYDDTAQDAVMRLLETGKATVNADGYLVAHPPVADAAGRGGELQIERIAEAIHESDPDVGCTWAEWVAYADEHPTHLQSVDYVRRQARAIAAMHPVEHPTALSLLRQYHDAIAARNGCEECDNEGPWEHCGGCSGRIGPIIAAQINFLAHPPVADAAVAGEGVMPSEIAEAIRATEYKYFGDYEMSDDQREAVDVLVRFAQQYYSPPIPRPAPCEPVDLREALAMAQEVRDLLLERIQGSPARSAAHNARVRADSLIQLLSSMTPALSTLTPDTIGSHYGNGGRFDPGNGEGDGLQLVLRAARELVEAYDDPNGPAFVKINALRAALAALTRTDEAGTDGEGR